MFTFLHHARKKRFYGGKKKNEDKATSRAPYFFFLAFLAVFLAPFATILTSMLQLRSFYI
jgi:hypothetical protein